MRDELKPERQTRISELCNASEVDEKLFWKLVKGKRPCSQFGSFLIDGKLSSPVDKMKFYPCGLTTLSR